MFNRVLQGKDTSLALGFISDVELFVPHTSHDTLMAGTTNDGGEDGTGSIVSGETGQATRMHCLAAGAVGYLLKPLSATDLAAALHRLTPG